MWPYWLDGHATNTVKNSFDMSSMYLLTGGPNVQNGLHCCYMLYSAVDVIWAHFIPTAE